MKLLSECVFSYKKGFLSHRITGKMRTEEALSKWGLFTDMQANLIKFITQDFFFDLLREVQKTNEGSFMGT